MPPSPIDLKFILDLVTTGQLSEVDLRHLLSVHINKCQYGRSSKGHVEYIDEDNNVLLTAIYVDRALTGLVAGPTLTHNLLDDIRQDIEMEMAAKDQHVQRSVLFASVPTEGYWRYREHFQLLPAPPEAPRPKYITGEHPLVLEMICKKSENRMLNQLRTQREARTIGLLLALLTRFGIHPQRRYTENAWVFVVEEEPELKIHSEFLQIGYTTGGLNVTSHSLSDPTAEKCEVVPNDIYFSEQGISIDSKLTVPTLLTTAFDHFYALNVGDQARFVRACYWFALSNQIWTLSHSASYNALVQALETLLPKTKGAGHCPSCDRPLGPGITKQFGDFLEQYAPGTDKKLHAKLYDIRSGLTHGTDLFMMDDSALDFSGLHPQSVDERWDQNQLLMVARSALINRLMATGTTPLKS